MNGFWKLGVGVSLLAAAASGQDSNRFEATIVVRHDPSMIKLDHLLVGELFSDAMVRAVRVRVLGPLPENARIDIHPGVSGSVTEQPPGVFVGTLQLFCKPAVGADKQKPLLDAMVTALGDALSKRLARTAAGQLERELGEVDFKIRELEARQLKDHAQLRSLPRAPVASLETESMALEAQGREIAIQLATEQVALGFLEKKLADARRAHEKSVAARAGLAADLAGTAARVDSLMAQLAQAKADREKLTSQIESLQQHVAGLRASSTMLDSEVTLQSSRTAKLDHELQIATLAILKLRQKQRSTERAAEVQRKRLAEVRGHASRADEIEFEIARRELELERLRVRQRGLAEDWSKIRPVRVTLWR